MYGDLIEQANRGIYTGCMAEMRVLLSFAGNREPYPETEEEHGPLLSLLQVLQYDQATCSAPARSTWSGFGFSG